jgi:hypothetical protein
VRRREPDIKAGADADSQRGISASLWCWPRTSGLNVLSPPDLCFFIAGAFVCRPVSLLSYLLVIVITHVCYPFAAVQARD